MELQVGDRVRLTEYGLERFSDQSEGGEGEVVEVTEVYKGVFYGDYPYRVEWDCGGYNVYTPKDLELVAGDINEEELYY